MHLTTRQAAERLGVSESTVKRMCDEGALGSVRTTGGHRRILAESLEDWIVSKQVSDGVAFTPGNQRPLTPEWVADCLLANDILPLVAPMRERIEEDGTSIHVFDALIAPAMWIVGKRWKCGRIDVYQEHLASRNANELIERVRVRQRTWLRQDALPIAVGGVPPSEQHSLGSSMVEIALNESGWEAHSLGQDLPTDSFIAAITQMSPDLVWLSSTICHDPETIVRWARKIQATLQPHQRLAIGGAGMIPNVRREIEFDFAGDSLAHLIHYSDHLKEEVESQAQHQA